MSVTQPADGVDTDVTLDYLEARLRIEPHPDAHCRLIEMNQSGDEPSQRVVKADTGNNGTCRAKVTGEDGQDRLVHGAVRPHCICPILADHDCITSVDTVEDGELIVSLTVPNRDEFMSIVSHLRDAGAQPRLLQITNGDDESGERVLPIVADSVTDKQREAVRAAVEQGYYDTPREATLEDLADHLDISRSAVSQRLTAVESKLVVKLFEIDHG